MKKTNNSKELKMNERISGNCLETSVIQKNLGKYIRVGGHGLVDGLFGSGYKHDFKKIMYIDSDGGMVVKAYRKKKLLVLSCYSWRQKYEIIDKKKFDKLPKSIW